MSNIDKKKKKKIICENISSTFNSTHHYQQINLGPIKENTVLTLDPHDGKVLGEWGGNLFYMPHGITVDSHDNLWVTDVALHQAFKVSAI